MTNLNNQNLFYVHALVPKCVNPYLIFIVVTCAFESFQSHVFIVTKHISTANILKIKVNVNYVSIFT